MDDLTALTQDITVNAQYKIINEEVNFVVAIYFDESGDYIQSHICVKALSDSLYNKSVTIILISDVESQKSWSYMTSFVKSDQDHWGVLSMPKEFKNHTFTLKYRIFLEDSSTIEGSSSIGYLKTYAANYNFTTSIPNA